MRSSLGLSLPRARAQTIAFRAGDVVDLKTRGFCDLRGPFADAVLREPLNVANHRELLKLRRKKTPQASTRPISTFRSPSWRRPAAFKKFFFDVIDTEILSRQSRILLAVVACSLNLLCNLIMQLALQTSPASSLRNLLACNLCCNWRTQHATCHCNSLLQLARTTC